MKLSELFPEISFCRNPEISSLAFDARRAREGSLFFCLRGRNADGHDFIGEAARRGAVAAVTEEEISSPIPTVTVADARRALALCSKAFYGNAADRLKIFAITGTNGKTTTAHILRSIFAAAGINAGLLGTNGAEYGGAHYPTDMTTPDPPELHRLFADMERAGVTHVAMEASAHALALKKTDGIFFAAAGFSNLTRDHLDYFGDMENYKRAKISLFTRGRAACACVNADDPVGREILARAELPALGCGFSEECGLRVTSVRAEKSGSRVVMEYGGRAAEIVVPLAGRYNVYNAVLAAGLAFSAGITESAIARGIADLGRVDGRFETYDAGGVRVIIDFAHTDDGLKNLLTAAREICGGRLIVVFGCGGDRDRTKRPIMGRVAAENADLAVLTSDNPRSERPEDIIADIARGIKGEKGVDYLIEPDRRRAIETALGVATAGDVVVIAGKGAENYIEAGGVKYPYSDRECLAEIIGRRQ